MTLRLAVGGRRSGAVPGGDPALAAPLHHGMHRDNLALFEDADLIGGAVHLDRAAPGRVGYAVEIAIDRHHAILGDPPFQAQHGLERSGRQRLQAGTLLGEVLADHPVCGGVHPGGVGQGSGREAVGMPTEGLATSSSHWRN